MKKILLLTIMLMVVLSAGAQNLNSQRRAQLVASSTKFALVKIGKDSKKWYAVMYFPVSYGDYYGVTGKNKRPRNASITDVMSMSDTDRKKFVQACNSFDNRMKFRVASHNELQNALNKHYNIQSENGPYSIATKGFYLAMDYESYKRMKALVKKYGRTGHSGAAVG